MNYRLTENKKAILECLSYPDDFNRSEYGQPPYPAARIADRLGKPVKNVSRTLKTMEAEGLVVSEVVKKDVWSPLNSTTQRRLVCYWNPLTQEEDRKKVAEWDAGADARFKAFLDRFMPLPNK